MADKKSVRMTEGSIWKHIISFAIPLFIGNLFQQLYNTVDSVVVGKFVSQQALAAVGSTGPVINMLVGLFMGLATGAGVVISQYFGAREDEELSSAVHTTMLLTLVLCVVITIAGVALVPPMLRLMRTPEDVFNDSARYLRIYFLGCTGLLIYNMGSGILRAVGDSKRPVYFLVVSAVTNTVLDVVFVVVFKMKIEGVAYATVIAQMISAVLVVVVLMRSTGAYRFSFKKLHINWGILKSIVRIGMPTGVQQAVTSFSNVFVQSYINAFGSACMAGWAAYSKVDQLVIMPVQSISLASTTFVGQNLGAGQLDRAKKGIRTSFIASVAVTAVLGALMMIFARPVLSLFSDEKAVIDYGHKFMLLMTPFYLMLCVTQVYAGALRGAGDSRSPMIIMLFSYVVFRQLYLYFGTKICNTEIFVAMSYAAGWTLCSILTLIYYRYSNWEHRGLVVTQHKD